MSDEKKNTMYNNAQRESPQKNAISAEIMTTPNPGNDEAIEQGCTCPVLDNAHGRGIMGGEELGFWITAGCPLHGQEIKSPESERFTQERT